jgi:chemotaxis protein methyltransferase CheR
MSMTLSKQEFQLFRDMIEKECGIALQEDKVYLIESRLASLVVEAGCESFSAFYQMAMGANTSLKDKIVNAMTTNETLWFRDEGPYTTLREKIFPEMVGEIRQARRRDIRLWSAACSTGQEPYSISMIAHDLARSGSPELLHGKLSISASDICTSALTIAKLGRYNTLAMSRGMLPGYKENYFDDGGAICTLKDSVKSLIQFQQFNLQKPFDSLGKFDIIFLRNVAIYFSHDFKVALYDKLARALNPGGYLFVGTSETLIGYSTKFDRREHGRCIYYQVKP